MENSDLKYCVVEEYFETDKKRFEVRSFEKREDADICFLDRLRYFSKELKDTIDVIDYNEDKDMCVFSLDGVPKVALGIVYC